MTFSVLKLFPLYTYNLAYKHHSSINSNFFSEALQEISAPVSAPAAGQLLVYFITLLRKKFKLSTRFQFHSYSIPELKSITVVDF